MLSKMAFRLPEAKARELAAEQRLRREVVALASTPQFTATIDVLIGIEPRRTEPAFAELRVCDDLIFARARTQDDFRYFIGHRDVVAGKVRDMANYLELGRAERDLLAIRLATLPSTI
jgi:hypothetical protein